MGEIGKQRPVRHLRRFLFIISAVLSTQNMLYSPDFICPCHNPVKEKLIIFSNTEIKLKELALRISSPEASIFVYFLRDAYADRY